MRSAGLGSQNRERCTNHDPKQDSWNQDTKANTSTTTRPTMQRGFEQESRFCLACHNIDNTDYERVSEILAVDISRHGTLNSLQSFAKAQRGKAAAEFSPSPLEDRFRSQIRATSANCLQPSMKGDESRVRHRPTRHPIHYCQRHG